MRNEKFRLYDGIFIQHRVLDTDSKGLAQKSFSGWQHAELTPEQWIEKLDAGQTIQPSAFTPKPDGSFTHKVENWVSTHFICADADNIKGVEFLDDGSDKNPEGVEPWTENGLLSKKFPGLTAKVYAVGESVSSMLVDPLHRRYRFVFVFDKPITSEKHYHHILLILANEFSIIPTVTRSPAQPVFGNAREGFNFHICGSTLNLADYPFEPETDEIKKPIENKQEPVETLQEFLNRHKITYEPSNDSNKFYVECPYKNGHTNGKSGKTDAYVFGDAAGWAFNCSHTSCKQAGLTTWESFRAGMKIPRKDTFHGGSRKGAGRKSNAEKLAETKTPDLFNGKPVVHLHTVEDFDGEAIISERSREVVSEEAGELLWQSERTYTRGDEIGVLRQGENGLVFKGLDTSGMQGEIARACSIMKIANGGYSGVANPYAWIAEDVLKNQQAKGKQIKVVLTHPFWNGTVLLSKKGYDAATQAYLDCENEYDLDTEKHTASDDLDLWKELLQDFPFREESDFENALSYVLTLIIRQGLNTGETVPLIDITAPREGVGKSLLADVLTAAVLGRTPIVRSLSSVKTEVEKEIAAALRGAPESVIFDNVDNSKPLDCATLASVVTQPNRAFRILGYSEEMFYENRATILYTGSNVEVTPELAKRLVAIRLSDTGVPEKDRKVKVEGLLNHTIHRHFELVSSVLRMVKRWIDQGSKEGPNNLHRMRQWSRIIHGIMLANGFGEHFMQNFDEVMLATSPDFTTWANAFKAIANERPEIATVGWTANDVFEILSHTDKVYAHQDDIAAGAKSFTRLSQGDGILDELIGTGGTEHARKCRLGKLLRQKTGNVHAGYKLIDTHKSDRNRRKIYRLEFKDTHKPEPETDAHTSDTSLADENFIEIMNISCHFYGKHQLTADEVSQFTGYDESQVSALLDRWYNDLVISKGVGDTYWMSDRDHERFLNKILSPAFVEWKRKPGHEFICHPAPPEIREHIIPNPMHQRMIEHLLEHKMNGNSKNRVQD